MTYADADDPRAFANALLAVARTPMASTAASLAGSVARRTWDDVTREVLALLAT